jgi:phage/plasmid-like protein (TIGR03299 family)
MAHAITKRKNGFHEMAYVGAKPWHGLGQELKEGASVDEWLVAAGMDWKVQRSLVRYATSAKGADLRTWDDYHVLLRSDTGNPLGMVSDSYKLVQPRQVLEFFRDLVEVAGFKLETAGTLYGGKKFWALASIQAEDCVVGKDLIKGKLLMASSCDLSLPTIAKEVAERVVCANTLAIAMGEKGGKQIQVSHRSKYDERAIKAQLGLCVGSFERFMADARKLSKRRVSMAEATAYFGNMVARADDAEQQRKVEEDRAFRKMMALFTGEGRGANLPGVKDTAWGLVNAVTEYVDHSRPAHSIDNRINNAWFGGGSDRKERAMEEALVLVR